MGTLKSAYILGVPDKDGVDNFLKLVHRARRGIRKPSRAIAKEAVFHGHSQLTYPHSMVFGVVHIPTVKDNRYNGSVDGEGWIV